MNVQEVTALDRFASRAAQCYVPRSVEARVRVVLEEAGVRDEKLFRLGAAFEAIDPADPLPPARSDAVVSMTRATLDAILDTPTSFDARSERFAGRLSISGDAQAAHHLLQLLKRPSATSAARLARALATAPSSLSAVPERESADAQTILQYVRASRPLCLRGVLDWPACSWSLEQFAARYGDVPLVGGAHGRVLSLRTFIGSLASSPARAREPESAAPYTHGCLLPAVLEPLFPFPFFKLAAFSTAQIWAGARRDDELVTRLHCDVATSFLAQVHGRKKVRLFAPSERERLYAFPAFNLYQPCRVDVANPDLGRFPDFADARYVDIVVGPGDLLIVPTGWYHCVWALDDVLSVSRFLDDDLAGYFFA